LTQKAQNAFPKFSFDFMSAWNAIELCTQSSKVRLVDGNARQKENADKGDFASAEATKAPPLETANF